MIEFDAGIARDAFRVDARFTAPAAATTALFGASGAGKSTLLALLAGALRPDRGRITIDGEPVAVQGPFGVAFNPLTDRWVRSSDCDINYMVTVTRDAA